MDIRSQIWIPEQCVAVQQERSQAHQGSAGLMDVFRNIISDQGSENPGSCQMQRAWRCQRSITERVLNILASSPPGPQRCRTEVRTQFHSTSLKVPWFLLSASSSSNDWKINKQLLSFDARRCAHVVCRRCR